MAARVRIPPPLVFLTALLAGIAVQRFAHPLHVPLDRAVAIAVGAAIAAAGVACVVSARVLFHRTGQNPVPWKPTPELILAGPYRFTRNPMYLGMAGILLGAAVLMGSLTPFIVIPGFMALIAERFIVPEEAKLEAAFGREYLDYKARVRRWL